MKSLFFISNNQDRILPQKLGDIIFGEFFKYYPINIENFDIDNSSSTYQILKNKKVQDYISQNTSGNKPYILVFKNSKLIEKICKENNYELLITESKISNYLEHKITQSEFFEKSKIPRPFTTWGTLEDIDFYRVAQKVKLPFVLQFGRGHSGEGSKLINNKSDFDKLYERYPLREVRCSEKIDAEIGTINVCLTKENIILGAPSLQITGVSELTNNPLSTVGNDWEFIRNYFKKNELENKLITFINQIGTSMRKSKYKGIFGIDFIIDLKDKKSIFKIIEINARFPASLVTETELAYKEGNPLLIQHHVNEFIPKFKIKAVQFDRIGQIPYYEGSRLILRDPKDNSNELTSKIFRESVYLGNSKVKPKAIKKLGQDK